MNGIFRNIVAEIVGRSERDSGFDSSSRHPDGEAARMMIPARFGTVPLPLAGNPTTEFSSPDHEGFVPANHEI